MRDKTWLCHFIAPKWDCCCMKSNFPILESTKDQRRYRELQQDWSKLFSTQETTTEEILTFQDPHKVEILGSSKNSFLKCQHMLILKNSMLLGTLTAVTGITAKLLKFQGSNTEGSPATQGILVPERNDSCSPLFMTWPSPGYPGWMWSVLLQKPEPKNSHWRPESRSWKALHLVPELPEIPHSGIGERMEAHLETQTLICQTTVVKELKLENYYFQKYAQSER